MYLMSLSVSFDTVVPRTSSVNLGSKIWSPSASMCSKSLLLFRKSDCVLDRILIGLSQRMMIDVIDGWVEYVVGVVMVS